MYSVYGFMGFHFQMHSWIGIEFCKVGLDFEGFGDESQKLPFWPVWFVWSCGQCWSNV